MIYKELTDKELNKQFYCKGLSISRMDFECMPCAMYTAEITDEQMQRLIDTVYDILVSQYYFDELDVQMYIHDELDNDWRLHEDINDAFWREIEGFAVQELHMPYYDDIEFDD